MHVGEAAAIGVERQFAAGGVALGDEGSGLAARHKAEIFEAVDRQVREGNRAHGVPCGQA
jgi:ABC-type phosphate/phosphonate transport system permease subunit